ncbi:MAG: hypothetical protein NTW19_20780 [Planctomycetota bacterium]|nr:hypothetical protein [Planctomycetota bacterium]
MLTRSVTMSLAAIGLGLALVALSGCDRAAPSASGAGSSSQVASSPTEAGVANVPILDPFQGHWVVDEEKTIALWLSEGRKQAEIDKTREIMKKMQSPLFPDLVLQGNVGLVPMNAMGHTIEGELLFFALHQHGDWVCGKAWRHEDRHDPGDMSKCLARLKLKDGNLLLALRESEGSVNLSDPDVMKMPVTDGSAETCKAEKASEKEWSPWSTVVMAKKDGK